MLCETDACTGCGACFNICPLDAITIKRDDCGFDYPWVDFKVCVGCDKCAAVCPSIVGSKSAIALDRQRIFSAAMCADWENLKHSSSGGIAFALSKATIDNGGVVFGAVYDNEMRVVHSSTCNLEGLRRQQGSKYVQSHKGYALREVKRALESNKPVLFVGTACEVDGLKNYLNGSDTSKLLTIDLLCGGATSPGLFHRYINYLNEKYHTVVDDYAFRSKKYGYGSLLCVAYGEKEIVLRGADAGFLRTMGAGYVRKSCFDCRYACFERCADITVGDFWGLDIDSEKWDRGVSLVFANSDKGLSALQSLSNYIWIENSDKSHAANSQSCALGGGKKLPEDYDTFFEDAFSIKWEQLYRRYLKADSTKAEVLDSMPAWLSSLLRKMHRGSR